MAKTDIPKLKLDFEEMIGQGELDGPDGFQAQTVNGTAHWRGTGWNSPGRAGWAAGSFTNSSPELEPGPTHPSGRSNRTAE